MTSLVNKNGNISTAQSFIIPAKTSYRRAIPVSVVKDNGRLRLAEYPKITFTPAERI